MKKIVSRLLLLGMFALFTLVSCGGGGDDSTPAPVTSPVSGFTINGAVDDTTGTTSVPVAGATVTLRKAADNSSLSTTTTTADGSYMLTNVPASTDVYINANKATYGSMNTQIVNLTSNLSNANVSIVSASFYEEYG